MKTCERRFRIVTNGYCYRIQFNKLGSEEWIFLHHAALNTERAHFPPVEFRWRWMAKRRMKLEIEFWKRQASEFVPL